MIKQAVLFICCIGIGMGLYGMKNADKSFYSKKQSVFLFALGSIGFFAATML